MNLNDFPRNPKIGDVYEGYEYIEHKYGNQMGGAWKKLDWTPAKANAAFMDLLAREIERVNKGENNGVV